jgi:hypothetical protein
VAKYSHHEELRAAIINAQRDAILSQFALAKNDIELDLNILTTNMKLAMILDPTIIKRANQITASTKTNCYNDVSSECIRAASQKINLFRKELQLEELPVDEIIEFINSGGVLERLGARLKSRP